MANQLTGFQIIAIDGLLQNQGLAIPNFSEITATYNNFPSVANFNTIFTTAPNAAITEDNVILLQHIGANTLPQIFGAVPFKASDNLGIGILVPKVEDNINKIFTLGNVTSFDAFAQSLTLAQSYASQIADIINSATSATWNGNPSTSITGGISAITGNDTSNIAIIANAFANLGSAALFNAITSGFSCAAIMQQILQVDKTIGNLHINFFGKTIINPQTGNAIVVDQNLLQTILSNPVVEPSVNSLFAVAALNSLDQQLQLLANQALVQTQDLDAVITFIGIQNEAAYQINEFSDCLNPEIILGVQASSIIKNQLNVQTLDAWQLLNALNNNIKGLATVGDFPTLAKVMQQTTALGNLNLILQMQEPVSNTSLANLQLIYGPGTGANGNPTVADVLGATNLNDVLQDTINAINQISSQFEFQNISTDTSNVANILVNGLVGNVQLSNGNVYTDANLFYADAANLINYNANVLLTYSDNSNLGNIFAEYDTMAQTVDNSLVVRNKALGNVALTDQSNISILATQLPNMALDSNEVTGLNDVIDPLFDSSLTGQALQAIIIESQNNNIFSKNGIISNSND